MAKAPRRNATPDPAPPRSPKPPSAADATWDAPDADDMPNSPAQPAFPIVTCFAALSVGAAGAAALAAWVAPVLQQHGQGEAGPVITEVAVTAAGVWLLYIAGVLLIAVAARQQRDAVMAIVRAWFAGMGLRLFGSVTAAVILVLGLNMEVIAVAVALASVYLVLLFVEAGLVGRYLWRRDAAGTGPAQAENAV